MGWHALRNRVSIGERSCTSPQRGCPSGAGSVVLKWARRGRSSGGADAACLASSSSSRQISPVEALGAEGGPCCSELPVLGAMAAVGRYGKRRMVGSGRRRVGVGLPHQRERVARKQTLEISHSALPDHGVGRDVAATGTRNGRSPSHQAVIDTCSIRHRRGARQRYGELRFRLDASVFETDCKRPRPILSTAPLSAQTTRARSSQNIAHSRSRTSTKSGPRNAAPAAPED